MMRRLLQACGLDERRCAACHVPFRAGRLSFLCDDCARSVFLRYPLCPLCGAALPGEPAGEAAGPCGSCLVAPPPWRRLHVVGLYKGALREVLLRLKFHGDRGLARGMGGVLASHIARERTVSHDVLIPMPLYPARLRQRGFNQCYELAQPVGASLGIPIKPLWAWRTRAVQPQTGLSRKERLRNLDNVFAASSDVRGKQVLIVDDTMTTGTSLRRLAECLLAEGAACIEAAAVAVVHPGRHDDEV